MTSQDGTAGNPIDVDDDGTREKPSANETRRRDSAMSRVGPPGPDDTISEEDGALPVMPEATPTGSEEADPVADDEVEEWMSWIRWDQCAEGEVKA